MSGEIAYSVRCERLERLVLGRMKLSGGCGTRPLARNLALKGLVSCPECGLEWPEVRLVAAYPPGFPGTDASAPPPEPAVAPRRAAPSGGAPPGPAQGTLL